MRASAQKRLLGQAKFTPAGMHTFASMGRTLCASGEAHARLQCDAIRTGLQGSKNKQMHNTTSTHLAELRVHVEAVIQAKLAAHEQAVNGYGSYESAVFRHTRSARKTHMDACGHDFASTRVPPPVARVHSARRSACLTSVRRIALRHGLCRRT